MRALWVGLVFLAACATSTSDLPPDDDGGTTPMNETGTCTFCADVCVDLKTDNKNCGKCGVTCPMGSTCTAGACQCASGQTMCNKQCVDVKTDLSNCGKCGQVCGGPDGGTLTGGGTWACVNGSCTVMCPQPKIACGVACVDTKTDIDNCGMCGNACDPMTQQCIDGQCCKTGEIVCPGDGGPACTDPKIDSNNCGMCGKVCSGNTPACSNGMCVSCGNDCWSSAGCLTQGGHCVKFMCRTGNAGPNFCSQCAGWSEITYNDWVNGGYCLDVFQKYNATEGNTARCGSNIMNCCGTKNGCGNQNAAWHFHDGTNTRLAGPCMTCGGQPNCTFFSGTDNSAYARLSVCKKN